MTYQEAILNQQLSEKEAIRLFPNGAWDIVSNTTPCKDQEYLLFSKDEKDKLTEKKLDEVIYYFQILKEDVKKAKIYLMLSSI